MREEGGVFVGAVRPGVQGELLRVIGSCRGKLDPVRSCLCNVPLIVTGAVWDDEPGESFWSLI